MKRYKIVRETLAEMDERMRKFEEAKQRANDQSLSRMQRWMASREMWEHCLGPAPKRVRVSA